MPYGVKGTSFGNRRSAVKSRQSAARAKTVAKARGRLANVPVKRAYYRRPVNKKSNYVAISTLARQVKQLQYDRNGWKQWHHVHANILAVYPAHVPANLRTELLRPTRDRPYAFMVNDFTPNASVFYGATQPGVTNIPSYEKSHQFAISDPVSDLMDQFNWNIKQGQDTCLSTHYLPIKSRMRFEFRCEVSGPSLSPITVRVTLFKLKNPGIANISAALPNNLYAYKRLVTQDVRSRNYFNTSQYHTIIADKYMTFRQTDVQRTEDYRVMTLTYRNNSIKPLNPDISNEPTNQEIYYTVPKKDQVWAIISTDCTDDTRLIARISRWNTWRDAAGAGS